MNTLPPYAHASNLPRTPGIYAIVNLATQHCYTGSTVNLYRRYDDHCRALRKGKHKNRHLQSAYDKYGIDSFAFDVIELVESKTDLLVREQHYLDTLSPQYNLSPTAGNTLGVKYTEEARRNLVEARSKWVLSPESIAKGAATRVGTKHSKEFGEAISARNRGRTFSEETRAKMSAARKGKPRPEEEVKKSAQSRTGLKRSPTSVAKTTAWHTGKKRSDEARARMSEGRKRTQKVISLETRAKLSNAGKGRVISEQARKKSSDKQKGRVFSDETRLKMSVAAKNRRKREREAKIE